MRYEGMSSEGALYPYPKMDIDPAKKDGAWCMQYAKAAFFDWSFTYPKGIFANNGGDYEKWKMYALGKQPNSQYKKMLGVDQQTNNTWLSVDWSIRPIVSVYRDRAISRLMEQLHSIVATPIDILAKSELQEWYAQMRAKLALRQLLQQSGSELSNHPMIALEKGDPMDIEELEMRMDQGEQFNRSKDAEMAVAVGFYENNYVQTVKQWYEDLFDLGVTGYKEWLGEDNKAKFRRCNPENVVVNYCRFQDFRDLVHAGEVVDVALIDLACVKDKEGNPQFSEEELNQFASTIAGKWGNPSMLGRGVGWFKPYDKFKCKVLDIEFYSYNDYSYRKSTDEYGNNDFRKADYNRGRKSDKYIRKRIKVIYKCKWIVGTDKCYDWGLVEDMKRTNSNGTKAETKLSYKFQAFNFYEMKAQGIMERLVPYLDDYQLTVYKIQNWKNRSVPDGWWINLDALENVALNKGGKNMEPRELIQMFFETGALVGRSLDANGQPMFANTQPIIPIANSASQGLAILYQDLLTTVANIEKLTGYNDVTMGDPNPKTLVPGYQTAEMSTTHALYPMKFAQGELSKSLGADVLMRMQQGVKKGDISGYAPALNTNSLILMQISPTIAWRDYGIELEERTTDDQKAWLLQQMNADIMNGFLDSSDAVMLVNTKNAKQAQQLWAYKVKKAKETMQQNEMQKIQAQQQGAQQTMAMQQQSAERQFQMQAQLEMMKQQMISETELKKKAMEIQGQLQMKEMEMNIRYAIGAEANQTKEKVQDSISTSKVIAQSIASESTVQKQHIANEGTVAKEVIGGHAQIAKQEVANKKPASTPKK